MARFPLISEEELRDPIALGVYEEIRQELGFGIVPNIFKSMALRPTLLRSAWDSFRATILQGYLPRTLKEMIGVLISQANGSEYVQRVHLHGLSAMGMSDEVLHALLHNYQQCPLPEREKAILRFGLLSGTDPLRVTQADYDLLHEYELSDEEIFEIVAAASLFASLNAYTDSIALEIDQLG